MDLKLAGYQIIRERLSAAHCSDTMIRQLKSHFQDEINSQRIFEKINSLELLLRILVKRDVIGYDHLQNLQYICEVVLPNDNIITRILNNDYSIQRNILNQNVNNSLPINQNLRVLPPVPQDRVERIHSLIRNDIGRKWRELARALSIGEGNIDALDERYRGDIPEMVNEILRRHQENCQSNFELWRSRLQQALVKARRRDLSVQINDILVMHS